VDARPPFVSRGYEHDRSDPEWGINVPDRALSALEPFRPTVVASGV
jgi:hypothetical protein